MARDTSKRLTAARAALKKDQPYSVTEALESIIAQESLKFVESVDVDIRLGIDPRLSDQQVRGQCVLPHGLGKTFRVAVFATGEEAVQAKEAGADIVGDDDLVEQVEKGNINFDRCIATPKLMSRVGKLGRILGPRNLMPNPKLGTVTADVVGAVKKAKAGTVEIRADKGGVIHATVGRRTFSVQQLAENIKAVLQTLDQLKPSSQKGRYLCKLNLSSTMGPGHEVDLASLGQASASSQ